MKKMLYKQKMTKLKNKTAMNKIQKLSRVFSGQPISNHKTNKKLLFLVYSPYRMWSYLKNLSEMHFESWH